MSVVCDALGNPLAFSLAPGQRHEITQAEALLEEAHSTEHVPSEEERQELRAVLADKGYDSDAFVAFVERLGAEPVIPAKKNRKQAREIDRELYKDRKRGGAVFQPHQALPSSGDALRQDGGELRLILARGLHHDVATVASTEDFICPYDLVDCYT